MEYSSFFGVAAVTALLAVLYWVYAFAIAPFRVLARYGIQGPSPVPFYGNQKMIAKMGRLKFITHMIKTYGPINGYYIGQRPVVLIADLDLLKEVTVKQFEHFQDRPLINVPVHKKPEFPEGIFTSRGDYWKKLRVTLSPTFSSGKMKMMAPLIADRCQTLVEVLAEYADTNKSVEVFHTFGNLTMETIIAAAFGHLIDIQRGESDQLVEAVQVIFSNLTEGQKLSIESITVLRSNFPWLEPIFRYIISRTKMAAAVHNIEELAIALIEARRMSSNRQSKKDLLQLMIDATAEDKGEQRRLTNEEIVAQCVTFIAAGYETTANALTYTSYLLALNPDIQEKLIGQITEYFAGHPDVSLYDMAQELAYLDMVVQESLRLYPPVLDALRHCSETAHLGSVVIPKGAQVTIPTWHIQHNAEHWNDPEKFDPERFTPEEKAKRHPLAHIPFGWGPRNCIGMRFALLETKFALILILRKYKFLRAPETEEPLQVTVGITMSPKNGVFLRIASHDLQQ